MGLILNRNSYTQNNLSLLMERVSVNLINGKCCYLYYVNKLKTYRIETK